MENIFFKIRDGSKKLYLHDFFYKNFNNLCGSDAKKWLYEYKFLIEISIKATLAMIEDELVKFDALVGENACQIRALKILLISNECKIPLKDLLNKLELVLIKTSQLLTEKSTNKLMQDRISVNSIIEKNLLSVELSEDQVFLIQCYILTKTKDQPDETDYLAALTLNDKTSPKKLAHNLPNISISFIKHLAELLKKTISFTSVKFIQNLAQELNEHQTLSILKANIHVINGRFCIPMFWTYKIIMKYAQFNKFNILIKVALVKNENSRLKIEKRESYLKLGNSNNYQSCNEINSDSSEICKNLFVIEGAVLIKKNNEETLSNYIENLKSYSIQDIILFGAACHRQFPDAQIHPIQNDHDYDFYLKNADQLGFSESNPSTYFIRHVFADSKIS